MTPYRLRRVALQRTRKRSQRDPHDFYHGLLAPADRISGEIAVALNGKAKGKVPDRLLLALYPTSGRVDGQLHQVFGDRDLARELPAAERHHVLLVAGRVEMRQD